MSLAALWRRLRHRNRYENDLNDELEFHFESRRDALMQQGHGFGDATRIARQELGMVELHKDAVRAVHGLSAFDQWSGELRRALRSLARSPMFTLAAVLILGAAIAVNLVLFSIYGSYVLRAPGVVERGELVDLHLRNSQGRHVQRLTLDELRTLEPAFAEVTRGLAISGSIRMPMGGDRPRTAYGLTVGADYFRLIDARAAHGRVLNREDDVRGAPPTILLSTPGWRALTAADPDIVGKSVKFSGIDFVVVGVMPEGFVDLQTLPPQFWISTAGYETWRGVYTGTDFSDGYEVSAVLAPGVTPESLRQRLLPSLQALPNRQAENERVGELRVLARSSLLAAEDAADLNAAAIPIFGLVLLVLVVACANLANLMLARAMSQRQELAIRASVGASRWRLMRQLMSESALLAFGGAAIGLVGAVLAAEPLHRYALSLMIGLGLEPIGIQFDWRVFLFAVALGFVATISFGLAPAMAVTGRNLAAGARRDASLAGTISPSRLRGVLMVVQVAGSLVLLLAAGLTVAAAHRANHGDIGFDVARLIDLRHPAVDAAMRNRVEQVPGVLASSAVMRVPLYGWQPRSDALIDGRSIPLGLNHVDERYFSTLGIPLQIGRDFRSDETKNGSDVAIISAATAALLWPGEQPLGKRITFPADERDPTSQTRDLEVIGIAADVASGLLFTGRDRSAVYLPGQLGSNGVSEIVLAVDPQRVEAIKRELVRICNERDAAQPCEPWQLTEVIAIQRLPFDIARNIASVLGLVALLISAIGLYGVVRFNVASRTREIGVRVALGATPAMVVKLVLHGAVRQVVIGVVIGLPVCLGMSWLLRGPLGTSIAFAPAAYLGVPMLLLATTLLATVLPARRATRIAPTEALREE